MTRSRGHWIDPGAGGSRRRGLPTRGTRGRGLVMSTSHDTSHAQGGGGGPAIGLSMAQERGKRGDGGARGIKEEWIGDAMLECVSKSGPTGRILIRKERGSAGDSISGTFGTLRDADLTDQVWV